jgi:N-dimethylarginine dimethylaminohydrolase
MKVLMVKPTYFDVKYSINPHMLNKDGKLNRINYELAQTQWYHLKSTFESIGLKVEVLQGRGDLPDMVFSANHALPLVGSKEVILGKMNGSDRQGEISLFKEWYINHDYKIHELELSSNQSFEGMGDAIWSGTPDVLLGGHGFRTNSEIYDQLEELLDIKVIKLKLINENFYHLDTCLCVFNKNTVSVVAEAFDNEGLLKIKKVFENIITIDLSEALANFAGNSFCPDGKNVILQKGSHKYCEHLRKFGFNSIEVDTSEYIKAGGSVFCMKMVVES